MRRFGCHCVLNELSNEEDIEKRTWPCILALNIHFLELNYHCWTAQKCLQFKLMNCICLFFWMKWTLKTQHKHKTLSLTSVQDWTSNILNSWEVNFMAKYIIHWIFTERWTFNRVEAELSVHYLRHSKEKRWGPPHQIVFASNVYKCSSWHQSLLNYVLSEHIYLNRISCFRS